MPNLTVKKIPPDLYERLKHSADLHHRSLNSEVLVCLERTLTSIPVEPGEFLARIDRFHEGLNLSPLTDEVLARAKNEGRP